MSHAHNSQAPLAPKKASIGEKLGTGSLDSMRRLSGLIGAPVLALIVYFIPIAGLESQAHTLLAVMTLVCLWWITEPIPIPITALLGSSLAVVLGVAGVSDAFASFANPIIFLFLGGFILAKAMMVHGLDKRFSYALLSLPIVGSSPTRIFLAIGIATALCSGWVSNTATAAMMLPISLGLLDTMAQMMAKNGMKIDLKHNKYATGLMLMTAYAASIGGVLTPIGTPPNLIMTGLLATMEGIHISFFQWMIWGAIAMILYFIVTAFVLHKMFPPDVESIEGASDMIEKERANLGPWTLGQKCTLACFLLAVVLWVTPGVLSIAFGSESSIVASYDNYLPESVVALIAAILLFLLPGGSPERTHVVTWQEACEGIDWGTLLLFGGGLSMGSMMYSTGLSAWVGDAIVQGLGGAPSEIALVATFCVFALIMSELSSHTAATNMVGPLGITAAVAAGVDPVPVAVGIALSASLGFMLPVSTPPNAIVYASGYVPITQMIKTGVIIDIIGIAVITVPLVSFVVTLIV